MQVLTVGSLLESAKVCCSSSLLSDARTGENANAERAVEAMHSNRSVGDTIGKRKGEERGEQADGLAKRVKSDRRVLRVLPQSWILVGRLQLCNKTLHSWNGLSFAADCLSFTDSTGSICCAVARGASPLFVGRNVRVNAWSFIPGKIRRSSSKASADDRSAQSTPKIPYVGRRNNPKISKTGKVVGTGTDGEEVSEGPSDASGWGFLEIHSLEVIDDHPAELPTFPSLCLNSAAGDRRSAALESPLSKKQVKRENRLNLCGTLRSISPQFTLPCRYSVDRAISVSNSKSLGKAVATEKITEETHERMVGFLVELEICHSCSHLHVDPWSMVDSPDRFKTRSTDHAAETASGANTRRSDGTIFEKFSCNRLNLGSSPTKRRPSNLGMQPKSCLCCRTGLDKDGRYLSWRSVSRIYFSGSVAAWRPILSGSLGRCIAVNGLRKKLICVGPELRKYIIFVATRTSLIALVGCSCRFNWTCVNSNSSSTDFKSDITAPMVGKIRGASNPGIRESVLGIRDRRQGHERCLNVRIEGLTEGTSAVTVEGEPGKRIEAVSSPKNYIQHDLVNASVTESIGANEPEDIRSYDAEFGNRSKTERGHKIEPSAEDATTRSETPTVPVDRGGCRLDKLGGVKEFKRNFYGQACDGATSMDVSATNSDGNEHERQVMRTTEDLRDIRLISYVGVVTTILFQGTLVGLDGRVWLLLTHQRHTQVHGLRVGVMLSLKDVHAVTVKNYTENALLLGACLRSHVSVLLFSPLHTPPVDQLHSHSLLLKYIQRISFASTFWVLSLIGSFRQKFHGIYSDKELLGSKTDPGIIQKYAQRLLAPDDSLERDAFKEFLFHQQSCHIGGRTPCTSIRKVPPFSNFCKQIDFLLHNSSSRPWIKKHGDDSDETKGWPLWGNSLPSLEKIVGQSPRLIIASEELGVTLLGSLQICRTSGELQLSDATGVLDVMIPDLLSSMHISNTYQGVLGLHMFKVSNFNLVVEGLREDFQFIGDRNDRTIKASPISWLSLLKEEKAEPRISKYAKYFIHFYMRDAVRIDCMRWCQGLQLKSAHYRKDSPIFQKQIQELWFMIQLYLDALISCLRRTASESVHCTTLRSAMKHPSRCIGDIIHTDRLFRVCCKVVGVQALVFFWQGAPDESKMLTPELTSTLDPESSRFNGMFSSGIPLALACFVIDDGSGIADCWAIGDAAVSLLGLVNTGGKLELPPALSSRLRKRFQSGSDMQLSVVQILCCLVRKHGRILLQSESIRGASMETPYGLRWEGEPSADLDERAFMQALVARACNRGSLGITCGKVPPSGTDCSGKCKTSKELHWALPIRMGHHRYPSHNQARAQLFAQTIEPGLALSDLKTLIEDVAELLQP